MKSSTVCSLLVGAVVFAAATVNAQIQSRFTITGTAQWQISTITNGNNVARIGRSKAAAFNTKTIIGALNNSPAFRAVSASIPAGSWFALDDNTGDIIVTNKNGFTANLTTLVDANGTSFARATLGNEVLVGREHIPTLRGNHSDTAVGTMNFQDGSNNAGDPATNSVAISGLLSEANSYTAVAGVTQNFTRSFHASGVGNGLVGTKPSVVQGHASGQGRGTELTGGGEVPQVIVP
jgi:hypothetical protein